MQMESKANEELVAVAASFSLPQVIVIIFIFVIKKSAVALEEGRHEQGYGRRADTSE